MSGGDRNRVRLGDSACADGKEAFEAEDWPAVMTALNKVLARRPWHGNAHSIFGFTRR